MLSTPTAEKTQEQSLNMSIIGLYLASAVLYYHPIKNDRFPLTHFPPSKLHLLSSVSHKHPIRVMGFTSFILGCTSKKLPPKILLFKQRVKRQSYKVASTF